MGSLKVLFDTNILIDHLNKVPQARLELDRFSDSAISIVTWIEVMAGATTANEAGTRLFLLNFVRLPLNEDIAERAASLRSRRSIKLPDAVIHATAQVEGRLLVTRNTRDFSSDDPGVRIPYRI